MEKGKLIPLISAAVLAIVAVVVVINNQRNNVSFDKLIVTYKDQKNEYDTVTVDDVIVVKDVSFWVVSTVRKSIVLNSSNSLLVNGKESTEIEVNLNKATDVCFSEDDCIIMQLL
ncbi:MAG: hypothetical protein IJO63_01125 [Bacilli bacterium]|nr:hypothetical protein [Bacilli bacterium]